MRGSLLCVVSLAHSGHFLTNSVSCFESPGHHTDIFALRRHRTIPWCPSCSFLSVSVWRSLGTTIRCPCMSRPFPTVSSLRASQNALANGSISLLSGHSSRQYLRISWHVGSSDWACLYVSRRWLLAGRFEMAAVTQSSAKSCRAMLSACLGRGALESVSTVYSSLPGTCRIS